MSTRKVPWKEGKIVSLKTRKGVFVLAQMLRSPYLRFYDAFREDENWGKVDVRIFETLFVSSVITKHILDSNNATLVNQAIPDTEREDSDIWINQNSGFREVKVWENTDGEKICGILGKQPGGSLVKKNLWWSPTLDNPTRPHPSGVIDAVILEDISLNADEVIDKYELTNLATYPTLNERLYLCYKLGKNVDPYKDLVFNRVIPKEYQVAIEIMSAGGNNEEKERILDTYFR
jgi:hypothetical protein